jgi:hypothetical protein
MADEQTDLAVEHAATAMRFALAAQLALTGQLMSALVLRGVLSAGEAAETINKIADMIASSLDRATSDLHSVLSAPMTDHAEALRRLADDLKKLPA